MTDSNVVDLGVDPSRLAVGIADAPDPLSAQIHALHKWRKILSVRWLTFIALFGALAIWLYATIDPTPWRFAVSCAFSVLVLGPTFWLYHARSE